MAIDLTQERADFEAACRENGVSTARMAEEYGGWYRFAGDLWKAWQWRAALAQSPVSAAAMRFVPDSECVQSRCANATTGCRHSCDLKPGGRLHNTFVVAAPVSAEGLEHDALRYRAIFDNQFSRLSAVKFREFDDPIIYTKQMADGHLDAAIAAADKGTTS